MKKKLYTSIGLMSGTSMDGVDLSVISSDGYDEFFNHFDAYFEFGKTLKDKLVYIRDLISSEKDLLNNLTLIAEIERNLTLFHGDIINQSLKNINLPIDVIGFHGHTIFHKPQKKITRQLGDGRLLSQIIKKKVIFDFRQEDIKNNGQGAPLTPIFHYTLSKQIKNKFKIKFPLGFLNIGGIANITKITNTSDEIQKSLFANDIGPGNCLIDQWIRNHSSKKYDKNGEIANSGKVDEFILNQAIENFKFKNYSQSIDIKDFDVSFARGLSLEDGCATITNFTAYLIAEGLKYNNQREKINFLLCGGGRKNHYLINNINNYLSDTSKINLDFIDNYNLDGDYIESQAFGYLAIRSLLRLPISFSNTTGCDNFSIGGKLVENF